MSVREDLEANFEKLKEQLAEALGALEGYDTFEGGEVESLADAMRRLGDTFHIRLMQIPTNVEYVRMKKIHVALLHQVLCDWANALDESVSGLKDFCEATESEWKKLETSGEKFGELSDKVLELLDEHAPELDMESELKEAERS